MRSDLQSYQSLPGTCGKLPSFALPLCAMRVGELCTEHSQMLLGAVAVQSCSSPFRRQKLQPMSCSTKAGCASCCQAAFKIGQLVSAVVSLE